MTTNENALLWLVGCLETTPAAALERLTIRLRGGKSGAPVEVWKDLDEVATQQAMASLHTVELRKHPERHTSIMEACPNMCRMGILKGTSVA